MSYIQTKAGIFKCVNVVVGLLAVALYGAGHDKHLLTLQPPVACIPKGGPCGHTWAGQLGMSIVILAWLFSIAIFLASLFTKWTWNLTFGKLVDTNFIDVFGHLIFGILLIVADALIIVYIVTHSQFACHAANLLIKALPESVTGNATELKCNAYDIFISLSFIYWLIGLIFACGATLLFFITSFVVKRQATVNPTTTTPINEVKY